MKQDRIVLLDVRRRGGTVSTSLAFGFSRSPRDADFMSGQTPQCDETGRPGGKHML
jgi:hypothetical protein